MHRLQIADKFHNNLPSDRTKPKTAEGQTLERS